jgi:hypothetical protein
MHVYSVLGGAYGVRVGEGDQTDKHLPQSPFTDKFLKLTTFRFGVYICSTTGKPTRSFATERVSLDSV